MKVSYFWLTVRKVMINCWQKILVPIIVEAQYYRHAMSKYSFQNCGTYIGCAR